MKRLIERARAKGRLTRRDAAAAHALHGHGLHPAQALVGTGLIGVKEYAEYGGDALEKGESGSIPKARNLSRLILRDAEKSGTSQVRIIPTGKEADVIFDTGGERRIPTAALPALVLRMRKMANRSGWHVEVLPAGIGPSLHLIRQRGARRDHPSDWMSSLADFRAEPSGLLVIIAPDAYVARHFLNRMPMAETAGSWRELDEDGPALYDADKDDGRELALHAVFCGRIAVALQCSVREDWWTSASEAGIPVRVLRSRLTSAGPAWEALSI